MNDFIYYNGKIYKFGIVPIKGKDFTFKGTYTENYHYEKNDFIQHDYSLYCAKEDFTATTFENDLQNNLLELAVRNTLQTITFSTAFINDSNEQDINANLVRDGGSVIEPNYKLDFINFDSLSRKANTARYIDLEMDNNTYRITAKLKNDKGEVIATSNVIDLPSESTVVNAKVSEDGNNLILTLRSGQDVSVSLGKMLSNLQEKITSSNKLPSDLVSDENQANKFVTEQEKTNIANNTNARHSHSNKSTLDKITEDHLTRIGKAVQDEDFENAMADAYRIKQDKITETIGCEIKEVDILDEHDEVVDTKTVLEVDKYNSSSKPLGFLTLADVENYIKQRELSKVPPGHIIQTINANYNPNNEYTGSTWRKFKDGIYFSSGNVAEHRGEQLPNIKGAINNLYVKGDRKTVTMTGALKKSTVNNNNYGGTREQAGTVLTGITFDASDSNSIYTNNGKVRPNTYTTYSWIRVDGLSQEIMATLEPYLQA